MSTTQERLDIEPAPAAGHEKHRSLGSDVWRQFRRHKGAITGLVLMAIIVIAVFAGPVLWQEMAPPRHPGMPTRPPLGAPHGNRQHRP